MLHRWIDPPLELTLLRHGHSVGNEADTRAHESGAEMLDLDDRDADVVLSETGQEQADQVGRRLREAASDDRPTLVVTSPYRRAAETAERAVEQLDLELFYDERLRERDLGVFNGLTGRGIRARHPEEAERRRKLGKFYYQPPSGESWCDVALRVRSFLADLRQGYGDARIWVVTHQAVIMAFRFALEGLSEAELLDIDKRVQIPNASTTTYRRAGSGLELAAFADTSLLEESGAERTADDADQGARDDEP